MGVPTGWGWTAPRGRGRVGRAASGNAAGALAPVREESRFNNNGRTNAGPEKVHAGVGSWLELRLNSWMGNCDSLGCHRRCRDREQMDSTRWGRPPGWRLPWQRGRLQFPSPSVRVNGAACRRGRIHTHLWMIGQKVFRFFFSAWAAAGIAPGPRHQKTNGFIAKPRRSQRVAGKNSR